MECENSCRLLHISWFGLGLLCDIYRISLRPLDARNLRILCMVFMTGQIMSGTQELSQNNTPEPFNRVLEAFFDP
jgi:hypothetical protein